MPIYEYQCQHCGHQLEAIQKINDAPLVKCPECGKNKLSKLVSATSFQLKGTGWYVTDFKNSDKKPKGKEKTENKPAETATGKKDDKGSGD